MKRLLPIVFSLAVLISINAQDAGIQFQHTTWEQTLNEAKKQDKIIFVDAYTTWCGPCKWMAANVFTQEEVGEFYNEHFVNVKIDMEKGEGPDIASKYSVKAYPTFLFIDKDGKLVHQSLGSRPVAEFVSLGEAATDPDRRIGTLMERYEAGERSPEFLRKYAAAMKDARMPEAEAAVKSYLDTQDDWTTKENAQFILEVAPPNKTTEMYQFVQENRKKLYKQIGEKEVDSFLKTGIIYGFPRMKEPTTEDINKAFKEVFPGQKGEQFASEFQLNSLMYSNNQADQQRFLKSAMVHMEKYPDQEWNFLNSIAWRFYETTDKPELLQVAKTWAMESVKKESNFFNNDTLAALCFKLNEKVAAAMYAKKAIELAKEEGADYEETEKLLQQIEQLD